MSKRSIQAAELFYTLLESADLANLEPAAYLHASVDDAVHNRPLVLPHEVKRGCRCICARGR